MLRTFMKNTALLPIRGNVSKREKLVKHYKHVKKIGGLSITSLSIYGGYNVYKNEGLKRSILF